MNRHRLGAQQGWNPNPDGVASMFMLVNTL
jgi:hypothetical protein